MKPQTAFLLLKIVWLASCQLASGQVLVGPQGELRVAVAYSPADVVSHIQKYGEAVLPPDGLRSLDQPLDLGNLRGGVLRGFGAGYPVEHSPRFRRAQSGYTWIGGDEPMIRLRGSHVTLENFTLNGCPFDVNADAPSWQDRYQGQLPSAAILVPFDGGLGSGQHTLRQLCFANQAIAIEAGETTGTRSNSDTTTVDGCQFVKCERGFVARHQQVIDWRFANFTWTATPYWRDNHPDPVFCYVQGGGNFHLDTGAVITPCTLFRLDAVDGQVGKNNALLTAEKVKCDNNVGNRLKICDTTDAPCECTIDVENLHLPGVPVYTGSGRYLAELKPGMKLRLRASRLCTGLVGAIRVRAGVGPYTPLAIVTQTEFGSSHTRQQDIESVVDLFELEPGAKLNLYIAGNTDWRGEILDRERDSGWVELRGK